MRKDHRKVVNGRAQIGSWKSFGYILVTLEKRICDIMAGA